MPGMDGVTALTGINRSAHPPKVLMLTTFDRDEHIYGALRAKAAGFLSKDTAPRDLIAAVRATADGSAVLYPTVPRLTEGAWSPGMWAPRARRIPWRGHGGSADSDTGQGGISRSPPYSVSLAGARDGGLPLRTPETGIEVTGPGRPVTP